MVEIKNLTKYYGKKAAVKNISFTIEDHEILGFLGPNGAGKSTTLNIISGVIPSSAGTVTINGHDIATDPIRAKRCIGFLPEIPPVYPDMKVKEYLIFVAGLKGVPSVKRKAQVARAMDRLRITDVANRLIRNLSKGYRQRVGFAQALLGDPDILILDEPTVGLDPQQVIEVRNLILELKQDHTVILSSHILSEISAVCDRVIIINKGEIRAIDTIEHLEQRAEDNPVLQLKVKGPSQEVSSTMRRVDGVLNVSNITRVKTGIYTYDVTMKSSDIRNSMLSALLVKKFEVLEVQEQKKNLEQVFVKLVNQSGQQEQSSLQALMKELEAEDTDTETDAETKAETETPSDDETDAKNTD
jgi:ABC-2 type transport system ATP-binding protein